MKYFLFVFTVIILDVIGCGSRHYEEPYLNVSPSEVRLGSQEGASAEITVTSNNNWTIISDGESWLNIYPKSGNDDVKIKVTALSNESAVDRHCTIIIEGGETKRYVVIIQKGKNSVDNKEDGA